MAKNHGYKKKSASTNNKKTFPSKKKRDQRAVREPVITRQSISDYFSRKKASHQAISKGAYLNATSKLKGKLLDYFLECYNTHQEYCREMGWETGKLPKYKKKDKQQVKINTPIQNSHYSSGNTLSDIATISSLKDSSSANSINHERTLLSASRQPKYGYARDRYGRIQERDKYDEERINDFKHAHKQQANYDYSNYDENDDHDSFYDNKGYD